MAFPQLGNSDHVVSFSIDFSINSKQDVSFRCVAYDYSRADGDGLHDHLRDVPWESIFKLCASLLNTSNPWFPAACAATIVHRNHFLHLYHQNKYFESKVNFKTGQ